MTRKSKQIWADEGFVSNLNKAYPQALSFREKTKKLIPVLEDMLYGEKK